MTTDNGPHDAGTEHPRNAAIRFLVETGAPMDEECDRSTDEFLAHAAARVVTELEVLRARVAKLEGVVRVFAGINPTDCATSELRGYVNTARKAGG